MTSEKAGSRRRYSAAMKAEVVAKVAMAHGINANVVHRWRQLAREGKAAAPARTGEFIALPLAASPSPAPTAADIRVELRRGPLTMTVTWPAGSAADFAAWARELLR